MVFLKKNWSYLVITCIVIGFFGIVYYNNQDATQKENESMSRASKEFAQAVDEEIGFTPEDYIVLGQYKGLSADKEKVDVSDAELDEAIKEDIKDFKKVKRAAQEGDNVNIDYIAYIDGKKEKNLTSEEWDMVIGEQEICPEFDTALVGKSAGDSVEVEVSDVSNFYTDEVKDYDNVTVKFTVKVNRVEEPYYNELTDEWVQEYYGEEYGCSNVSDYKKMMKNDLLEENGSQAEEKLYTDLWNKVLENCIMNEYPQELYEDVVYVNDADIAYQAEYWGMSEEEYCEFFEIDRNKLYVEDTETKLIVYAIVKIEGIDCTDEEVEQGYHELYEEHGYESAEAMKEDYFTHEMKYALLKSKVMDFVVENAVITEVESVAKED